MTATMTNEAIACSPLHAIFYNPRNPPRAAIASFFSFHFFVNTNEKEKKADVKIEKLSACIHQMLYSANEFFFCNPSIFYRMADGDYSRNMRYL